MRLHLKAAKAKGTKAVTPTMTKVAVVETSTWPSVASPLASPDSCCDHKRKSRHTAAIAGGVVASILVLIIMVVAIVMYCRRKLRCRNRGDSQAVPFLGMSTREVDGASEKDWGVAKNHSMGRVNADVA